MATKTMASTKYLTKKEGFRLWFECLNRAAKNPFFTVDEAYYKQWGEWRGVKFDLWWQKTGKVLLAPSTNNVAIATTATTNENNLLLSVPKSLTPTQAANEVRALLIQHYTDIKHTPIKQQTYALTEGAEMRLPVVRSYLHTYDAYQRLLANSVNKKRDNVINRTGRRDSEGKKIAGSELAVSGKELLNEVRVFYLTRTERWKNTKRRVEHLPSSLTNGMTVNPVTKEVVNYGGVESSALRAVKRYLDSANNLIANAARGEFPGDY